MSLLDVVKKIKNVPTINKEFVVGSFWEAGLQSFAKALNEDARNINNHEAQYQKKVGSLQETNQISDFTMSLMRYKIKTFLEIGTWCGVTFSLLAAVLSRYGLEKAISIDLEQHKIEDVEEIKKILPIEFKMTTSKELKGQNFDLCFIDGNHDYEWVKEDFNNVGKFSKLCAFHDIIDPYRPDVVKFWNEIKHDYKYYEFTESKSEKPTMGIGLLEMDEKWVGHRQVFL